MTSIPDNAVVQRSNQVVANALNDDETVMLDVDRGKYFGVEGAGHHIWETVVDPTSVDELIRTLLEQYEVDESTCRSDTLAFLSDLADNGLISVRVPDADS